MDISAISPGQDVPNEINVVIEIPHGTTPVKYEFDKASGGLFVDRVVSTPMHYPTNYGFIPQTLAGDGDPCDVLMAGNFRLEHGCVIRARPVGVLITEDEKGSDIKILAVPHDSVTPYYKKIKEHTDLPPFLIDQIRHFFEHYKDLEPGKWVKVSGWENAARARELIMESIDAFKG